MGSNTLLPCFKNASPRSGDVTSVGKEAESLSMEMLRSGSGFKCCRNEQREEQLGDELARVQSLLLGKAAKIVATDKTNDFASGSCLSNDQSAVLVSVQLGNETRRVLGKLFPSFNKGLNAVSINERISGPREATVLPLHRLFYRDLSTSSRGMRVK
jgi:hypothetical protein